MTRNSVYYWAGAATAMVLIAAIPAAFCEAVWSGEWRWLFAMIPGILIWNVQGMMYVYDRTIQSYIDDERSRVMKLARKVSGGLLLFCIDHAYSVEEIATARQRYEETPRDDAEDLM